MHKIHNILILFLLFTSISLISIFSHASNNEISKDKLPDISKQYNVKDTAQIHSDIKRLGEKQVTELIFGHFASSAMFSSYIHRGKKEHFELGLQLYQYTDKKWSPELRKAYAQSWLSNPKYVLPLISEKHTLLSKNNMCSLPFSFGNKTNHDRVYIITNIIKHTKEALSILNSDLSELNKNFTNYCAPIMEKELQKHENELMQLRHVDSVKKEQTTINYGNTKFEVISERTLLHNDSTSRYSIKNLFDNNLSTAWVTRFNKNDPYDFYNITIEFHKPEYVENITIANGYQKNDSIYAKNQRAMEIQIATKLIGVDEYNGWLDYEYELKDTKEPQVIELRNVLPFKMKGLKIRIRKIFDSEKYDDLCISELKLNFAKENPYKPKISYTEFSDIFKNKIKKFTRRGQKCWDFIDEIKHDSRNTNVHAYGKFQNDLEKDLYFYAISNKDNYKQIYYDYCPTGTGSQQWLEMIIQPAMEVMLSTQ